MARKRNKRRAAAQPDTGDSNAAPKDVVEVTQDTQDETVAPGARETEPQSPQETPSSAAPPSPTVARHVNGGDIADSDSSDEVSEDSAIVANGDGGDAGRGGGAEDEEEEEDSEEEILVVLELADFKNHPVLDDYKSITIEGIDTPKPKLHIDEYSLHGQLEETVGTHYFYDTKNRTEDNEYRFVGQTTKKIKFTIAPPDEY